MTRPTSPAPEESASAASLMRDGGSKGRVAPAWSVDNEEGEEAARDGLGTAAAAAAAAAGAPLPASGGGDGYDYARSTTEVFGAPDPKDRTFTGPFADIRAGLDYGFHRNYRPARQTVQDAIVQRFLDADAEASASTSGSGPLAPGVGFTHEDHSSLAHVERAPEHLIGPDCRVPHGSGHHTPKQWVVFTAGPMGAGKSHCLKWMARRGFFPLDDFVLADPDLIRNELPENTGYIREDPLRAGSQTHREAGYILEILIRAALLQGRNVLVQGSLRDSAWHADYFQQLRALYPGLRIAIVHVTAGKATVLERARRRGATTHRVVPDEVLLASLEQTPRAVAELAPLVDYCVTIDNDGREPRLVTPTQTPPPPQQQEASSRSWTVFSGVWRDCHLPTKAGVGSGGPPAPSR